MLKTAVRRHKKARSIHKSFPSLKSDGQKIVLNKELGEMSGLEDITVEISRRIDGSVTHSGKIRVISPMKPSFGQLRETVREEDPN